MVNMREKIWDLKWCLHIAGCLGEIRSGTQGVKSTKRSLNRDLASRWCKRGIKM